MHPFSGGLSMKYFVILCVAIAAAAGLLLAPMPAQAASCRDDCKAVCCTDSKCTKEKEAKCMADCEITCNYPKPQQPNTTQAPPS